MKNDELIKTTTEIKNLAIKMTIFKNLIQHVTACSDRACPVMTGHGLSLPGRALSLTGHAL